MSDQLSTITNIVFIDAAVPDYRTLIAGLPNNSTYFVLDAQKDGIAQIEQYLAGYSNLDSIQILSHGSQGSLYLGNAVLSNNTLKQYQEQLSNIGSHLKDRGDILLYGCNVAQGDTGLQFIDALAKATGADVAASNDITGSAALGGDWLLETNTGSIEVTSALTANSQATYAGSLVAVIPVVSITPGITPVEGSVGSFIVTLDSPAPVGGLTINYSMSGTATLNTDYTVAAGSHVTAVTNGSFTVAEGQTTASLIINTAGIDGYDPGETIDLSLHTGSGYSFVSNLATFDPKVDFATGSYPRSVSVGDFNGDGKLDLAVANANDNTVSVLLRNAANTGFDPKVDFATGSGPYSVGVGDFNDDGKLDLAVANLNSNAVSVLLHNIANTGFDSAVNFYTGLTQSYSVSVGDFNGDGKADLAVVNSNNTLSVLLRNTANNGFDPKVDFATSSDSYSVSVGDFNGDGKTDLAVVNYRSGTVSVLLRNTTNTDFDTKVDYTTGLYPSFVTVGDFNGDGKTDLVVAKDDNTVSVLLRNAANTGFDPKVDFTTGSVGSSISVGDFNDDGKTDLAVAHADSNTVSVLLRNAANTGFDPKVDFTTGFIPYSVSVGDFNSDGKTDLAVANAGSNTVCILLNNSTPNASLIFTDDLINTAPRFPTVTPSLINGTLTSSDAINPFSAGNYYKAYTPIGFIDGRSLTIALASTDYDTYLQVIRNGSILVFNDDSNDTSNSLLTYTYQTGDSIYITSFGGLLTGAYSLNLSGAAIPPVKTLTTSEDTAITLTTTMLPIKDLEQTAAQLTYTLESIANHAIISKSGITLNANDTLTQADVDNGLISVTPNANFNGADSFTFNVADGFGGVLANQTFAINVTPVNDAPTLTAFAAPVASGFEDPTAPIAISFTDLKAQGNEADIDSTVTAFVIKTVSTGTLKIGTSTGTAILWDASLNNTVDATQNVYWKPDTNANGILNAFTAVAKDEDGLESVTSVQATVSLTAVPDVTVTGGITPVEGGVAGTFKLTLDSPAPTGGLTIDYTMTGTATQNTDYTVSAGSPNITAVTNNSFIIAEGQTTGKLAINAFSDGVADPGERINLYLSAGTGYQASDYEIIFTTEVVYTTGLYPRSVTVGDFNGDGKTDLAIANYGSSTVSVLLRNTSNTGFEPKVDFTTGSAPTSVCVGDFNGDGKLDLAIANANSYTVSVLLRNTDNTGFEPKVDNTTSIEPISVSVGDFNGDGKADLAVANAGSSRVSVLLRNTSNTGFDPKVDIATDFTPYSVTVGDFNGDGKTDLAVANAKSDTVSVLLRNADNTDFEPKVDFASGSFPFSVTVGDLNGDGKTDLAAANYGGSTVSVLLRNTANTGFDPKVDFATAGPYSVCVGDFNGDGKLDLAVANLNSNTVSVLLNSTLLPATLTITDHNPANISPTLTSFQSPIAVGVEDKPIVISLFDLQSQSDARDSDGIITGFVIKSINTGSLLIGSNLGTATAWDINTNNTVDINHQAYWIPAFNFYGISNAFTAVAKDNGGFESSVPIQTQISVTPANDLPTGTVTITGIAKQNQLLTANNILADVEGLGDITYQWYANNEIINGANISTIRLTQALVAKTITVTANYTDSLGTAESVSSLPTPPVVNVNELPTGEVVISGNLQQNQLLTASNTLVDNDGLGAIQYSWFTEGNIFAVTSESTQLLSQDQVGKSITVIANYIDLQGTFESVSSLPTQAVLNINDVPIGEVLISGLKLQGETLSVTNSINDADGVGTITFNWYSDKSVLSIGTGNTYILKSADVGNTIKVVASYTDLLGTNESVISSSTSQIVSISSIMALFKTNIQADFSNDTTFFYAGPSSIISHSATQIVLSAPNGETQVYGGSFSYNSTGINWSSTTLKSLTSYDYDGSLKASITRLNVSGSSYRSFATTGNGNGLKEYALRGNDYISGSTFDDNLYGYKGNDIFNGGEGIDTLAGGVGNDNYLVDTATDTIIELLNQGTDTVKSFVSFSLLDVANVENLTLSGSDPLNGTGNELNNVITGNSDKNKLDGGFGIDILIGGLGDDTYYVDSLKDIVTEKSNAGIDTIQTALNSYSLNKINNVENLIYSGLYAATLTGNSLSNNIVGGSANDTLIGGLGNDTLTGSAGADHFVFNTKINGLTNLDTLADFESGIDKIDLSKAIFKSIGSTGTLNADAFYANAGATSGHDTTDRFVYNTTSGALYYDADGSGKNVAVQIALIGVASHPDLVGTDFIVA